MTLGNNNRISGLKAKPGQANSSTLIDSLIYIESIYCLLLYEIKYKYKETVDSLELNCIIISW